MFSGDGEKVPFHEELYPTGNVEEWLLNVEKVMRSSLRHIIEKALEAYPNVSKNFTEDLRHFFFSETAIGCCSP